MAGNSSNSSNFSFSTIIISILILILTVGVIVSIYYYFYYKNALYQCENTENILCPSYFCGNTADGKPTTLCSEKFNIKPGQTNPNPSNSAYVPYRWKDDKKSKDINTKEGMDNLMCQQYTVNNNTVLNPQF